MPRSWIPNIIFCYDILRLLEEMVDSTTRARKSEDEPGTSCHAGKWECAQRMMGPDKRTWVEGTLAGPIGDDVSFKRNNDGNRI